MNVLDETFDVTEALTNDPNGYALRAVKDELENMKSSLKKQMDKGLSNDEFKLASNLQVACQTAQDLAEKFWSKPKS